MALTDYPIPFPQQSDYPSRFPEVPGTPVLLSIAVTPTNPTFRPTAGTDRLQMTATGTYNIGPTQDLTAVVTWGSGTPATATVAADGKVAAVAGAITGAGEATSVITATLGAVSGNTTVTVDTNVDATKGWRVPANAYQWTLLNETPNSMWLCQEGSGNLADSIGSLTLTAGTTPLYGQTMPGFTRLAVGFDNATNDNFTAAAGAPNPATTSVLWLGFFDLPAAAPAATRDIVFAADSASPFRVAHHTTDRLRVTCLAASTDGTVDPSGNRCIALQYDRTNSKANAYSDQEKITGTYNAAVVDGPKGIGNGPANAGDQRCAYLVMWSGAAAERTTGAMATLVNKLTKTTVSWS